MTLPKSTRPLRSGELPPPGSRVYVPENTTAVVGDLPAPGWQPVLATDSDDSTVAVKSANGHASWVLSHNLLVDDKARRPTVGDRVRIDAPEEPHHGEVGEIVKDDKSGLPYFVEFQQSPSEWFYAYQVSLVSDGDTFPGEADTTTLVSISHTTTVTLQRPVTALQLAIGAAAIDSDWPVTVHTYADRIEIIGTHEETRG